LRPINSTALNNPFAPDFADYLHLLTNQH